MLRKQLYSVALAAIVVCVGCSESSNANAQTEALTNQVAIVTTPYSHATAFANNHSIMVDNTHSLVHFSLHYIDPSTGLLDNALYVSNNAWNSTAVTFAAPVFARVNPSSANLSKQTYGGLTTTGDGNVNYFWYGSDVAYTDYRYANQIHYGVFHETYSGGTSAISQTSATVPLTITGLNCGTSNPGTCTGSELWQEHPDLAEDSSGNLYGVWESHSNATIHDAIGYNMKPSSSSTWLNSGSTATPPYILSPSGGANPISPSRPSILAASATVQYVFAYGFGTETSSQTTNEQLWYCVLYNGSPQGWHTVAVNTAVDQRHYAAVLDPSGNVHVVWREGTASGTILQYLHGTANGSTIIWDTKTDGSRQVIAVSPTTMVNPDTGATVAAYAGTPTVSATSTVVRVGWTQWWSGFINSHGDPENNVTAGSMADSNFVEGYVMYAHKSNSSSSTTWTSGIAKNGISAYPKLTPFYKGMLLTNYPVHPASDATKNCRSYLGSATYPDCIVTVYYGNVY